MSLLTLPTSEIISHTCPFPRNQNVIYSNNKEIYQEIEVIRPINKANFPVYLVQSKITRQKYAMKAFAHQRGQPVIYYHNEARFGCLKHPNVIRRLYFEQNREAELEGFRSQISYIIMENASRGDFLNLVKNHRNKIDEKLARTYFRQLIEGLEYLHSNSVSHMDLKLDNLLIGDDGQLKIADFDMAHFKEDAIIMSSGTRLYRAPEVKTGKCNIPEVADVYSAGIILFILKTQGVFPQFEEGQVDGIHFAGLLEKNTAKFWTTHSEVQKRNSDFFSKDFQDLFISMTKVNPHERASIKEIKKSKWYNGPVYNSEELKKRIDEIF